MQLLRRGSSETALDWSKASQCDSDLNLSDPEKSAEKLQKFRKDGGVKTLKISDF